MPVKDLIRSQLQSEEGFTDQRSSQFKLTLHNVCAVRWEGGVQYTEECSVHWEISLSTPGVFSTLGDIMSTPGGYHDECGDIISAPGDVQYTGVSIQIQLFFC